MQYNIYVSMYVSTSLSLVEHNYYVVMKELSDNSAPEMAQD